MKLLDLFSGAGGAAMGYHQAGFDEIVGIDIEPQKNYPFEFIQGDALNPPVDLGDFDLIHASPPCQAFTVYNNNRNHVRNDHPDLIGQTQELLAGRSHVIENVPGAPLNAHIVLCGTAFGIEVRRHRLFESSFGMMAPPCYHGRFTERKYPGSSNRPNGRTVANIGEWRVPFDQQCAAMGIDWMTFEELSQAVPPVYTEFIGQQFLEIHHVD